MWNGVFILKNLLNLERYKTFKYCFFINECECPQCEYTFLSKMKPFVRVPWTQIN